MTIKLSEAIDMTKLSRRARRALSRGEFAIPFEPQYNGKAPITFAEYLNGFKNPKSIPARLRKSPLNKAVE